MQMFFAVLSYTPKGECQFIHAKLQAKVNFLVFMKKTATASYKNIVAPPPSRIPSSEGEGMDIFHSTDEKKPTR